MIWTSKGARKSLRRLSHGFFECQTNAYYFQTLKPLTFPLKVGKSSAVSVVTDARLAGLGCAQIRIEPLFYSRATVPENLTPEVLIPLQKSTEYFPVIQHCFHTTIHHSVL